jgi:hypothetical protein
VLIRPGFGSSTVVMVNKPSTINSQMAVVVEGGSYLIYTYHAGR